MKTLFFTLEYPPFHGGVSTMYANIVAHWPVEDGSMIEVIDNNGGQLVGGNWPVWKWLKSLPFILSEIRRRKPDHVIIGHILPLGTVVAPVARILGLRYSVIMHGMDLASALKGPRKSLIAKLILKNASVVICANSYVLNMLKERVSTDVPSLIVNPGIADRELADASASRSFLESHGLSGRTIGLTICRLVKRKGIDKMIHALPMVIKKIPDFQYIIGGTGPDEGYIKACVNNLDPATRQHVRLLGLVKEEDKWRWLSACDLFIMPSRLINDNDIEGFGIVYLEAALAGKPVVAGDTGGVRDAVIDGFTGLVIDAERTENVAATVVRLGIDAELRQKLGEQGRTRALAEFPWPIQAGKILAAIKNNKSN